MKLTFLIILEYNYNRAVGNCNCILEIYIAYELYFCKPVLFLRKKNIVWDKVSFILATEITTYLFLHSLKQLIACFCRSREALEA